MKIKKLIHFYELETYQGLEKLATEGGYSTLTGFLNSEFVKIVGEGDLRLKDSVGIDRHGSHDKKAKNSLKSGKELK